MKLSNFVKLALPSAVLALGLISTPASATNTTTTTTMPVTANVLASCSISASTLAFGTIPNNPTGPINANTNVTYSCTTGTTVTGITFASNVSGPAFTMKGTGTDTLVYNLSLDVGYSSFLSSGTLYAPTPSLVFTSNGSSQSLPVYGQIAQNAAQAASVDNYTDSVTVTFTY